MLPLKAEQVVTGTKDSKVEFIDEIDDVLCKKKNRQRRLDCFDVSRAGIRILSELMSLASSGHCRSAAL